MLQNARYEPGGATPTQATPESAMDSLATKLERVIVDDQGHRIRVIRNGTTQVQNTIKLDPPEDITDPTLLQRGVPSRGLLIETPGDREALFGSYKKRQSPRQFFKLGRVFMVCWAEPAGVDTATVISNQTRGVSLGRYGETVYSSVRRFVVVREADTYCSALPVTTYNGRGVAKPGVNKSEHAIIYTGRTPPEPQHNERPTRQDGGRGMRSSPIRIDTDSREDKLDPMSRLNFGAIYTIQHNIKVKPYGMVHQNSRSDLLRQFVSVWQPQQPMSTSPQPGASQTNAKRQGTLDPRLEAAAIQRLIDSGMTEDEARERLRINLIALLAKQGQKESTKGLASKADAVFAVAGRRDSVASPGRPIGAGVDFTSTGAGHDDGNEGGEADESEDREEEEDEDGDDQEGSEDEGDESDEENRNEGGSEEEQEDAGSDQGSVQDSDDESDEQSDED